MGGAFGVAIFGSIFNSRLDTYIAEVVPAGSGIDSSAIQGGAEALDRLPPPIRTAVIDSFARSLHVTFLWGVPIVLIGFAVVLFLKEQPLRETAHVGLTESGEELLVSLDPAIPDDATPQLVSGPEAARPQDGRST